MAEIGATAIETRKAGPRIRGVALGWRLALALSVCVAMLVMRIDIGTAWLFGVAALVGVYRLPRTYRLLRAGDPVSAAPWLVLIAGTVLAIAHQVWAQGEARTRFHALAAEVERDPCRAASVLPAVVRPGRDGATWHAIRVGLLDYPVLVRTDPKSGTMSLVLHVDIDDAQLIETPGCRQPPGR